MSEAALHLVKVPLRVDRVIAIAKRRGINIRTLDDGYLAHCLLMELWQADAPAPFVLRGKGRVIDVWGYTQADAAQLIEHATAFGDPVIMGALDDVQAIASRPVPCLEKGRRVGFLLRACPVTRLAKERNGYKAGVEVDVFLAKAFSPLVTGSASREEVYREWLIDRFGDVAACGANVEEVRIAAFSRVRLLRRTQGAERQAKMLERPDVRFTGDLTIADGNAFMQFLARGVGRHKAFGFGAMVIVPPGTSYPNS